MNKITSLVLIIVLFFTLLPLSVQAFSLVPCGTSEYPEPCNFQHLLVLIVRLINYLISVAALVAMYHILLSGWNLITAMGNEEKVKVGKAGVSNAVVGFAMVVLAFIFVNLAVNLIFGTADPATARPWWDINCIFDIVNASTQGCPGGGT